MENQTSEKREKKALNKTEGKLCFVIMPFSNTKSCTKEEWTYIFDNLIKPSVQKSDLGLYCERSNPTTGDVIKDIIQALYRAEVVIADLTDQSANVFWELGVRHSLRGTNTILFTQHKADIPSDICTTCAWHLYGWKTAKQRRDFKKQLVSLLTKVIAQPGKPDNPVAEFLQTEAEPSVIQFEDETSFFNNLFGLLESNPVGAKERLLAYINQTAHEKNKTLHYFKDYEKFYKRIDSMVQNEKVIIDYCFLFCSKNSFRTRQVKDYLKPYFSFANSISILSLDRTRCSDTALNSSFGLLDSRKVVYVYERDADGKMLGPRKIQGTREYLFWYQRFSQIVMDSKTIFQRKK